MPGGTVSEFHDMSWIEGGRFRMGSNDYYPEEAPVHETEVQGFWIDRTAVTNVAFGAFVATTGYVTLAERSPDPLLYPGADPALLIPGSLVFQPGGSGSAAIWRYVPGACWRHPEGPGSSVDDRPEHPVVHIAHEDALAFAQWAGKALPTEAEWEHAARGGLDGAIYSWGDTFRPEGHHMANTWQGPFPVHDSGEDGFVGTSPVASFPPNGYGLFDMAGNVWEWTADTWRHRREATAGCCGRNPTAESLRRKVIKGGSFLCAPGYCMRYRPAARQPQTTDSSTNHIGFRCIRRP